MKFMKPLLHLSFIWQGPYAQNQGRPFQILQKRQRAKSKGKVGQPFPKAAGHFIHAAETAGETADGLLSQVEAKENVVPNQAMVPGGGGRQQAAGRGSIGKKRRFNDPVSFIFHVLFVIHSKPPILPKNCMPCSDFIIKKMHRINLIKNIYDSLKIIFCILLAKFRISPENKRTISSACSIASEKI